MIKRMLSYLYPITVRTYQSDINGRLEITYLNGKKLLDTSNSNFSYGSLQRVLFKGLKAIGFNNEIQSVLLLGLGGGSVIRTLRDDFVSTAHISAVELDPGIIFIAGQEFGIEADERLDIIQADAGEFLKNNTKPFDLIIVDLFIGDTVPTAFTSREFISKLAGSTVPQGRILFNTMTDSMEESTRESMIAELRWEGMEVEVRERVNGSNTLILAKKIN